MLADLVDEWPIILMGAALILIAMVLAYRLMNRDPDVRRSRYGFFVERDRFDDQEGWTDFPLERTLPERTVELPPKEEK